jgi:GNAT superfamily N-acetyltransferase
LQDDSIDALYVDPKIQRAGWGSALINAVKPTQSKLSLWTFQANHQAVAFYQSQGFQIAEVTDGQGNAEKLPDCFMTWERAAA